MTSGATDGTVREPTSREETRSYRTGQGRHGRIPDGTPSDRLQLDADLRDAVRQGAVVAHFQPVYDVGTGRLWGFEALARWHHATRGSVPPDVFIPLAEDDGLINEIGDRMLRAAYRFLAADGDRRRRISVNVSTEQLAVEGFTRRMAGIFERDRTLLSRTTLEVTESSLILDHDLVAEELAGVRALGVGVAIDDFGCGYSSLSQLQELPVTELKIDRVLVQRSGVMGRAVLRAVIRLAAELGLTVVAEGVERPEQLQVLRELGCDRVQGFLFAPAMPPELARALPPSIDELLASKEPAASRSTPLPPPVRG